MNLMTAWDGGRMPGTFEQHALAKKGLVLFVYLLVHMTPGAGTSTSQGSWTWKLAKVSTFNMAKLSRTTQHRITQA